LSFDRLRLRFAGGEKVQPRTPAPEAS
jgi:hypothetical protein